MKFRATTTNLLLLSWCQNSSKKLTNSAENKFSISHIGDQDQDLEYKKRMIHTIGPSNIMLSLST
jgi:hypothetical protein